LRGLDFTNWHSLLITLVGLALVTLIGMGIRLVMMFTIQQRRERMNRQINERLKTLIAAYKVLGGSFTGDLTVDPSHKRDLARRTAPVEEGALDLSAEASAGSDRTRRIRDAVEASLADIILLGTEDQVRLAQQAARELVAGRPVKTHELVVSLRDFIRQALDLASVPAGADIPLQGPTRPSSSGGRGGGGAGGSGGGMGGGMGIGMGGGTAAGSADDTESTTHRS
jgi:uncharacterized membrane protein YgcG